MFFDSNRPHSWATSSMWYTKCLMQIQVAHISSYFSRTGITYLSIHISPIHVHLASFSMDHLAHFDNIFLKDAMS